VKKLARISQREVHRKFLVKRLRGDQQGLDPGRQKNRDGRSAKTHKRTIVGTIKKRRGLVGGGVKTKKKISNTADGLAGPSNRWVTGNQNKSKRGGTTKFRAHGKGLRKGGGEKKPDSVLTTERLVQKNPTERGDTGTKTT